MLAVVAECNGEILGVAGVSADSAMLWQVGVDVRPDARQLGIGQAIVQRVTARILETGRVPYYTTETSNIASQKLAARLGYCPARRRLYAVDVAA